MDEQAGDKPRAKPKRKPPSRRGKGPTSTSWKPGQSGNPHGRPKHLLAFSERVRERVDPDLVIELALRTAEDESLTPAERLAALLPLVDRGWVKPPNTVAVALEQRTTAGAIDWSAVPTDELRQLHERLAALPRADRQSMQPAVSDDDNG